MNHQTEPSAAHRQFAANLWQMFVALQAEGFSERQALIILGQMLASSKPDEEAG